MTKISVVFNTLNEEAVIKRAIESVKDLADEILVCDMLSDDNTATVAKKAGAKLIFHKRQTVVEPARNFAISKASGDWILVLDPDEELNPVLAAKLREIAEQDGVTTYVEITRQNLIFGKWVKAAQWWPDYHIRFFKAKSVDWPAHIHSKPITQGQGLRLPAEEQYALKHHHYTSISQYLVRLDRYTTVQAAEITKSNYKFKWVDLIQKPQAEFLGRFFANKGYQDGIHGLALCLLQAFSFLIVYLKVWEAQGFKAADIEFKQIKDETKKAGKEINYWLKYGNLSKNATKRFWQKIANRLS